MSVNLLLAAVLGAAAPPTAEQILSEYRSYELMTPQPVAAGAAFLENCVRVEGDARGLPHGDGFISIFMNAAAAAAFREGKVYPAGSVIVKRKEPLEGQYAGFGGMIKRLPGYDLANGDWEYFTGTPEHGYRSGRLAECGDCHARARPTDHVFGDWNIPPSAY